MYGPLMPDDYFWNDWFMSDYQLHVAICKDIGYYMSYESWCLYHEERKVRI